MSADDKHTVGVFERIGMKWCSKHPDFWIVYPGLFAPNVRDCPECAKLLALVPSTATESSTDLTPLKRINSKKVEIGNRLSNTLHRLKHAVQTYAGRDLPDPDTYADFPFLIGAKKINSHDCVSCNKWVFFATFSGAQRERQATANGQERFCVFLLTQRDKFLEIRTKYVDLEARSGMVHRIHADFLVESATLKSVTAENFSDWVAFNTSCTQLTEKEKSVTDAFTAYNSSKHQVLEIAEQVQKTQMSLKARDLSVKAETMNDLLFYIPELVEKSAAFTTDIATKLQLYESHLNIVRAALKKLIDNQAYEID